MTSDKMRCALRAREKRNGAAGKPHLPGGGGTVLGGAAFLPRLAEGDCKGRAWAAGQQARGGPGSVRAGSKGSGRNDTEACLARGRDGARPSPGGRGEGRIARGLSLRGGMLRQHDSHAEEVAEAAEFVEADEEEALGEVADFAPEVVFG